MKIYNTLTSQKEEFAPLEKNNVKMYLCGPTVYDLGHLGHARSALSFDIMRKYLKFKGYNVIFASNYTDIDDKMINRAKEKNISVKNLADLIIPEYEKDYQALNIDKPDFQPKATEHVESIIKIIEKLLEKGFAYKTDDGVYFDVLKFNEYGKLSKQRLEDLEAGARISVIEQKKSPHDFVLWKNYKEGEPFWESPFGKGRPGWHIECSAMNLDLFGETIDIHGGGADLIFPHHEDEIAQSEAYSGKQFARFWVHNGFVQINEEKMSKSLGNFKTIRDVLNNYSGDVIRYLLITTHYRSPINFSEKLLIQAKNGLERINDFIRQMQLIDLDGRESKEIQKLLDKTKNKFIKSMDNDFEITGAFAGIFDLIKEVYVNHNDIKITKIEAENILNLFKELNQVLGIMKFEVEEIPEEILKLVKAREEAREERDFQKSDKIREEIKIKGFEVEDTKDGSLVKKVG
ncbi:MAG: Cysteine-tRNA ligase [Candidatus Peregrinibacteria bacterium GW2011_GWA2_33_10]|nr:MAG: Cysteine-tRNA ligase [Candidatus Peregrinibacteria bacterium GW2011_GWA2_33_10]KKP41187.1 MAG: cysteinyl-tRNA synthetase, cysteinyl-tRNA synthetase [Candidatus Peregrinibacteria bacterium GW2011_GWC2_33_13]OGJ50573.1 MAG: cysteine--tRNA ligase [Candidatus Peregrinibacteria bacterium RIFOXYA2_FULL_33_7]